MATKTKISDFYNPFSNSAGGMMLPNLSKVANSTPAIGNFKSNAQKAADKRKMADIINRPRMTDPVQLAPYAPRTVQSNDYTPMSIRALTGSTSPVRSTAQPNPLLASAPIAQPSTFPNIPPVTTQAPVQSPATQTETPKQWLRADGSVKTPQEIASDIAETLKRTSGQADVGTLAGNEFGGAAKTEAQLRAEAAMINNARNDIAVGANDPYKVASESGIAYTPAELQAIEKSYAGIYDPAINTAYAKLEAKQAENLAKEQAEAARIKAEADRNQPFTLGKGDIRYDGQGNVLAQGSASSPEFSGQTYTLGSNPTVDSWVSMISSKRATLENAPQEIRGLIAQGLDQTPNPRAGYIINQANEAIRSIDTIFNKIGGETSGLINTAANPFVRSAAAWIPGSDSRDVEAARTALEAIVGFDTLTQMREAAPSGASGLGQITEKELRFLQSVQGSLDTLQSNEQLFETLRKVQKSFKVLRAASSPQTSIPTEPTTGEIWKAPDNSIYEFVDGAWDEIEAAPQTFRPVGNTTVSIPESSRLAYVNNNPGNLRFAGQPGAVPGEGGFARFNSPEEGAEALARQVQLDSSRGLTLSQFIAKYAPPTENDTNKYISDMVTMTGASPATPISNIDLTTLVKAIARKESSTNIT